MRVAIIGGGFAGCAAARQFHAMGWKVSIFERGNSLGAGVRTQFISGHPYTFGPRHFLTKNPKVYEYLDSIVPMRTLDHRFLTYVDGEFFNYPISLSDVPRMRDAEKITNELQTLDSGEPANLEEYWIGKVGQTLYEKFIKGYSKKMWQIEDNRELDVFDWSPKGTPLKTDDSRAWSEAISAYPVAEDGYNKFFEIDFAEITYGANVGPADFKSFDAVVNTISLDDLFGPHFGPLPYIGRDMQMVVLPVEYALPKEVFFLYYAGSEKHTRIVEYKKLTGHKSPHTLIGIETPSKNGKHYPLPMKKWKAVHEQYKALLPPRFYSIGRAGSYDYKVDIDDCIEQAMQIAEELC